MCFELHVVKRVAKQARSGDGRLSRPFVRPLGKRELRVRRNHVDGPGIGHQTLDEVDDGRRASPWLTMENTIPTPRGRVNMGSPPSSHLASLFKQGMTPLSEEAARRSHSREPAAAPKETPDITSTRKQSVHEGAANGSEKIPGASMGPTNTPFLNLASPASGSTGTEDLAAPVGDGTVPKGVDSVSYLYGERSALLRAFKQVIPHQQTLGALQTSLDELKGSLKQESNNWRVLEARTEKLEYSTSSLQGNISYVEKVQIPKLQQAISELQGISGIEGTLVKDLKEALRERPVSVPTNQVTSSLGYVGGVMGSTLGSVFRPVARQIAHGDEFVIALARRILYGTESTLQSFEQSPLKTRTKKLISTLLLLSTIEVAWKMQLLAASKLPTRIQRLMKPVSYGIKTSRICLWSSAFVLGVVNLREFCATVASRAVNFGEEEEELFD